MKSNGTDRPLPKKLPFYNEGAQIFRLGFRQRLRVLFGYNVIVQVLVNSQHNPGCFAPELLIALTPQTKLVEAIADTANMVPVAKAAPEMTEKLEIAVDRLLEKRAGVGAGKN